MFGQTNDETEISKPNVDSRLIEKTLRKEACLER
jgi:hypothetical protein